MNIQVRKILCLFITFCLSIGLSPSLGGQVLQHEEQKSCKYDPLINVDSHSHANEEDSSDDLEEFILKGDLQDIDQDISQMEISLSSSFEPLSIVAECVNVSTGVFFQTEQDFIGDTIDPIHLTRHYDDKNYYESFLGFKFGCQFPLLATSPQDSTRHTNALIGENNGSFLPYQGKTEKHFVNPAVFKKDIQI